MKDFHFKSKAPKSILALIFFQTLLVFFITKFDPITLLVFGFVWCVFLVFKLKISVTQEAFTYQLYPFKAKKSSFDEIEWVKFIQIDALGDFWGWGLRYNKKYSWSYVLEGNQAILIQWKNGKKRLFSFENTDDLKAIFTEKQLIKNPKVVMF